MKKVLSVLTAALMLLSCCVFASAENSLENRLEETGTEPAKAFLLQPPKQMQERDLEQQTTDKVSLTSESAMIETEDGLRISYIFPSEHIVCLTQDLQQQALLYLLFYSGNVTAKANEFVENGMHLNIYDLESETDIYLYTEESLVASIVPNLSAMSEDDVEVVQYYLKDSFFDGANSVTAGMIGNNLWIFGDYGTAGLMVTFVNGIQVECFFRYVDASGPITGLTLLDGLSVEAV